MEEKMDDGAISSDFAVGQDQDNSGLLDASDHDGNWRYYKQQAYEQKSIVGQLASLLETYGYHLPTDTGSLKAALSDHLAQRAEHEDAPPSPRQRRILSQGSAFITDTSATNQEKFEQIARELPQLAGVGCEVRVKGLGYSVQRAKGSTEDPTVGDNLVSLCKTLMCLPLIEWLKKGKEMETKVILDDVNAVFKPSTTTLVLGAPGSGKSTLLKSLAGLLKHDAGHVNQGSVTYNGATKESGKFSLPKVAHFAEQADRHLPTMTVLETFKFAFDSMSGGTHGSLVAEEGLNDDQKDLISWMDSMRFKVEMITRNLGLFNAKDTIVGDNSVRGVSGGERRRVTLGEMLCGPQTVFLLDSISTGLDSSTTFDIMNTLKSASRSFHSTVVVALLQPPPETYALFDNIILMSEGKIIFHGAREDVVPYFNSLGMTCPPRKDEADWLVELTGEAGNEYRTDIETAGGLARAPVTSAEFHARWRESEGGKAIDQELRTAGSLDEAPWPALYQRRYPKSWWYHQKLCFEKKSMLMLRDKPYMKSQIMSALVMGLIVGSIFYDLGLSDANAKFGLIFFSLLFLSMSGMAQIPGAIERRGVFYKQSQAGFYPTSCEVVADTLVNTILTVVASIIFAPVVYFLVGFSTSDNGARFFTFMVIVIVTNVNVTQYFRFLAAFMPNFTLAQGFAGLSVLVCVLFCGYLIPGADVPAWWIWAFHVNPLTWAFRAAVLNEFQSPEYEDTCGAPDLAEGAACPVSLGQVYIDAYGFEDDKVYIWGGIAFIFVEFLLCAAATGMAYQFIQWDSSDSVPIAPGTAADEDGAGGPENMSVEQFNAPVGKLKRQASQLEADLPFEPVTMTFSDVSYSVPHPSGDGNLELLSGISGFCKPGEMTALMGSSGAGKTTLLDVLAGRKTGGTITGDIRLNGHPKQQKTFTRVAGYVEQQDMHSTVVTVKEALMFSATMRLDNSSVNKNRREEFVDSILSMLELDVISDRLIGSDEEGGLSLEQRKRTTLGVELAANPSIVFLDEPTSGLDARSAQVVMRAIRKVAATQRAVICTIHQPSTYLFEMFDALLLLKKGGQVVFFGPLGENSTNLICYLQSIPNTVPIRDHVNPATWMLEVIGAGTTGKSNPQMYADSYKRSKLRKNSMAKLESLMIPPEGSEPLKFKSVFAASPPLQARACMERAVIQYWRNPNYNWMRMQLAILIAVIFGSSFIDADIETESDLASRLAVIFMSTMFVGVICLQTAIPAGAKERIVFYREQAANMYSVRSYAIGYAVAELPYILFISLAFCSIFYWITGLADSADQFFMYWLYFLLWTMFMVFTGMMFVMVLPNTQVAQTLAGALSSMFSLFAGFLISPAKIPDPWLFAFYLNPLHYVVEGMSTTQYRGDDTPITTALGTSTEAEDFVNDFFGGEYEYKNRWFDVMGLVIFILAVRMGYLYALKNVRHLNR
ncbi:pleiotropic drug resistance transporter [Ectocarpus siliculosus]|uniref:Pleiotropic drug resistance transporter n=1 Tax=Ectocarpus siliculosus TaxID=2880 RepID=D8LFN4_ECTSI|nr:pleiotropic drug resistance transporter [Ectocarpus siliculosus]|eukprot:CBN79954.1 pleiotropic drug resistance transporter [Ectocarpus siliculosus]